jgi:hypothetical protein
MQPVGSVYVIKPLPTVNPVTTPEVAPTAITEDEVVHIPPEEALLNDPDVPTQTAVAPVIDAGNGLTDIVAVV